MVGAELHPGFVGVGEGAGRRGVFKFTGSKIQARVIIHPVRLYRRDLRVQVKAGQVCRAAGRRNGHGAAAGEPHQGRGHQHHDGEKQAHAQGVPFHPPPPSMVSSR